MGHKNAVTKRFCGDKIRFADLVNGLYFQGQQVVLPEELSEAGEVYAVPNDISTDEKHREYLERSRDIKMQYSNGGIIRLLAIENQHYIDYTMPFRSMQYDTLEYQHQLDEIKRHNEFEGNFETGHELLSKVKKIDRLWPVYTICLYLGEETWDGPRSLRDMMDFGEDADGFSKYFADYPFRLYCVNEEQDFYVFHNDVRSVFELLPLRKDKKRLKEKLESNKEYAHMNEDCLEFLSVVMDSPRLWKDREKYMSKDTVENNQIEMEGYDVCQAIRELIEDGRQEGKLEGRLEGKKEGRMEALKLSVENLMKSLSISLDKACELLDINEECDKLKQMID